MRFISQHSRRCFSQCIAVPRLGPVSGNVWHSELLPLTVYQHRRFSKDNSDRLSLIAKVIDPASLGDGDSQSISKLCKPRPQSSATPSLSSEVAAKESAETAEPPPIPSSEGSTQDSSPLDSAIPVSNSPEKSFCDIPESVEPSTDPSTPQPLSSEAVEKEEESPESRELEPRFVDLTNQNTPVLSVRLPRFVFGRIVRRIEKKRERALRGELDDSLNMAEFASFGASANKSGEGPSASAMLTGGMAASSSAGLAYDFPDVERLRREREDKDWLLMSEGKRREYFRERRRKQKVKFIRRLTLLVLLTPLYLYYRDNGRAKEQAVVAASRLSSTDSEEIRKLIRLAQIDTAELVSFYEWLLNNAEELGRDVSAPAMSVDSFGSYFAKCVSVIKERKKASGLIEDEKVDQVSDEEELKDLMKSKYFSRSREIEAWDLGCLFRQVYGTVSTPLPLELLLIGVSQLSKDDTLKKNELAFRVAAQDMTSENPSLGFTELVSLIDAMVVTGHFTTKSLVKRVSWWPHGWSVYTPEEVARIVFEDCNIQVDSEYEDKTGVISMSDFHESLARLSDKKWHEKVFHPWIQVWYSSQREQLQIQQRENARQRKEERERKERLKEQTE